MSAKYTGPERTLTGHALDVVLEAFAKRYPEPSPVVADLFLCGDCGVSLPADAPHDCPEAGDF